MSLCKGDKDYRSWQSGRITSPSGFITHHTDGPGSKFKYDGPTPDDPAVVEARKRALREEQRRTGDGVAVSLRTGAVVPGQGKRVMKPDDFAVPVSPNRVWTKAEDLAFRWWLMTAEEKRAQGWPLSWDVMCETRIRFSVEAVDTWRFDPVVVAEYTRRSRAEVSYRQHPVRVVVQEKALQEPVADNPQERCAEIGAQAKYARMALEMSGDVASVQTAQIRQGLMDGLKAGAAMGAGLLAYVQESERAARAEEDRRAKELPAQDAKVEEFPAAGT